MSLYINAILHYLCRNNAILHECHYASVQSGISSVKYCIVYAIVVNTNTQFSEILDLSGILIVRLRQSVAGGPAPRAFLCVRDQFRYETIRARCSAIRYDTIQEQGRKSGDTIQY